MSTIPEEQLQHKLSAFLDEKQISTLLKVLGTKCAILCTAALKLFSKTIPPEHVEWKRRSKCIACLVKHEDKNSMELIVLNLDKKKIHWEKELPSEDLEYKQIKPLFHLILDADDGMIGLNFKSEEEAKSFAEIIHEKLTSCNNSTSDSDSHKMRMEFHAPPVDSNDSSTIASTSAHSKFNLFKHLKPSRNAKKLVKDKISTAFDFAHIHHMAYDHEKDNFTYDYMDSSAKYNIFKTKKDIFSGKNVEKLLEAAGVTQSELNEEENEETKSRDSEDSKSIDTKSSMEDNLETTSNPDESKSSIKISTVSENFEFNKIMSELKLYQRESYYAKDFVVPLTPKIVDFNPDIEEEDEEEDDLVKEKSDNREQDNEHEQTPPQFSSPKKIFLRKLASMQ